ncbi:MAG: Queuine tRNA-ribosyltransferase [Candidatus Shapirobacteria bacterium GW2011_GWF1_38_23]|nr:MAG: Queuine tRNA-ribosyltransferase [Candidatus Shapirobacteria bacterium GW2011_GWF2_37_20]KKQ65197.1 MAG: Queuine tRNA-ribosyltransferase [Candidatus Shapirobacteria bacterium GW2011_GWF1_38_23]
MNSNRPTHFKTLTGDKIQLPIFFPDATRAVLKTLDSEDIKNTQTLGVLVNTFHLYRDPGHDVIKLFKGVKNFMNWSGGLISDSGGFQVMSLAKTMGGNKAVTDTGVTFKLDGKKILFTPEMSIKLQLELKSDMVVVLDDFTDPKSTREEAKISVERTLKWAKECRQIFDKLVTQKKLTKEKTPYLLGVVQGGKYLDLRKYCTEELVKIGFDGLGYGGWPIKADGTFDYEVAQTIADFTPKNYFLYALGIGKPHEITALVKMGWNIFDCVLPTRDARHKRLYVSKKSDYSDYEYYTPDKNIHYRDSRPVSEHCDCLLCQKYSRSYLAHLFRIKEISALRLATIHNLRFYSKLMETLRTTYSEL